MEKNINDLIQYLKILNEKRIYFSNITVYGWQKNYSYTLNSYLLPFLFENFVVNENIAPKTNNNRDLRIRDKMYITVHDTGDTAATHNAKFWSDTVYNERLMDDQTPYAASFQYVVGNDGIYHNIPDNEIAYHAGDSTKFDYKLYKSNVKGTTEYCDLTIKRGYFYINNQKTIIKAPLKNGKVCHTEDINDFEVLVKLIDGEYYIGEVYYNETYKKIANRGGNNNSIGIEMCVNEGSDLTYTYSLTGKLIAHLLCKFNLDLDDIKPHHFFSGKPCPETLLKNDMFGTIMHFSAVEFLLLQYLEEGYTITLLCDDPRVLKNGIVVNNGDRSPINYQLKITYKDQIEIVDLVKNF